MIRSNFILWSDKVLRKSVCAHGDEDCIWALLLLSAKYNVLYIPKSVTLYKNW